MKIFFDYYYFAIIDQNYIQFKYEIDDTQVFIFLKQKRLINIIKNIYINYWR